MNVCQGIKDGMRCQCNKLIDAHIVARAFAKDIKQDSGNVIVTREGVKTAKAQHGVFDKAILCAECDGFLGAYDNYGVQICREFSSSFTRNGPYWHFPNGDGKLFAKFILSVLWRASISKRPEFSQVNLGPYEGRARDIIFGISDLDIMPEYELMLCRYESSIISTEAFYTGIACDRNDGYLIYGIGLNGFQVCAKLDKRLYPKEWETYIVNKSGELRGVFKSMNGSSEQRILIEGAFNYAKQKNSSDEQ